MTFFHLKLSQLLSLLFCVFAVSQISFAQAPQKMSYQSVIRDANNELLAETSVDVRISIIPGSPDDVAIYVELHETMTNINGLVSLELGDGDPLAGIFTDIDWGSGPYFIQSETVPDDSPGVILNGVSELLSVPYALYANEAGGGAFSTSDNVTSNTLGEYAEDDFVFGSPQLDDDGLWVHDSRMYFDKSKGALRAGRVVDDSWDDQNVGMGSIGLGSSTVASGLRSIAIGLSSIASGSGSISIGANTISSGSVSVALGDGTNALSYGETAIGTYNTLYTPQNTTAPITSDRLFVIGNGGSVLSRSDAMVVLKNGNTGIGTSNPNELLEIGGDGRAFFGDGGGGNRKGLLIDGTWLPTATRIESYNYTNGQGLDLVFNDVGNGDVGIKVSNPNVSLDVSGSIEYTGTITDVSDERLKENFETIENPLESISNIQGYSYNMKDDEEKVREYGVIAQEIQKVFPELVTVVDEENGYLGVSYVQLIPILLEAIKEQQEMIVEVKIENAEIKAANQVLKVENDSKELRLENHEARLEQNTELLQKLNSILKAQASK